ncbi:hypothetical protein ACFL01_01215 [Planctomycetota bacterium]
MTEPRKTHSVDVLSILLEAQNKYSRDIDFTIPRRGIQGKKKLSISKGAFLHIRELFENAVTYGITPPQGEPVQCSISIDDGAMIIETQNESPPINLAPLKKKFIAAVRENRVARENDGSLWVCGSESEVADRIKSGLACGMVSQEEIELSLKENPNVLLFVGRLSGHESEDRPGGIGLYLVRKMAREGGGDLTFSCRTHDSGHTVKFTLTLPVFEDI